MSKVRPDYLRECITDPALVPAGTSAPLDEFTKQVCLRCANRECARAGMNNAAFDRRVTNWQSDLFVNVPRASDDDPRFAQIRSKVFAPAGTRLEIPGNPNFAPVAPAPTRFVVPQAAQQAPIPAPEPVASPAPVNPPAQEAQQAPAPVVNQAVPPSLVNAPFQQGTVLPGGSPAAPAEEVQHPGSSFTFDD